MDVPFGVFLTRYLIGNVIKSGLFTIYRAGMEAADKVSKFLKDPRQTVRDHSHQTFGLES
jgi:hypothetical protein